MYLPPYSPDLNPIEEAFLFIKAYLWHFGNRFRQDVVSNWKELPLMFLYEALDEILPEHAKSWMRHSGYIWLCHCCIIISRKKYFFQNINPYAHSLLGM